MSDKVDWMIYLEGRGPTHNGLPDDADTHMSIMVKALRDSGQHEFFQIRFNEGGREENWREHTMQDLHQQLVDQALKAEPKDALRVESTDEVGLREQEQVDEGGESGEGVHRSHSKGQHKESSGKSHSRKKEDSKTAHERRDENLDL